VAGVPQTAHQSRIDELLGRLRETTGRFGTRLAQAGPRAEQAATGWSVAQVAVHVAMVNDSLSAVIEGSVDGAVPAAPDFEERAWSEVVRDVPARNEAPRRFHPPERVSAADAIAQFDQSAMRLERAISSLSPERATYTITNRVVGTISLYQAGEFAVAHMIRHNMQAKRILET
jgi:hypothetical protein